MTEAEPLLRTRLGLLDEIKGVHGLPEFDPKAMGGKPTPCAFVVFDGYRVLETTGDGALASIASRWLVVMAVKNMAQAADGAAVRAATKPVVEAVAEHLMGWRPGPGLGPLKLVPAPRSDYEAGHLFFPLAFECEQILRGSE